MTQEQLLKKYPQTTAEVAKMLGIHNHAGMFCLWQSFGQAICRCLVCLLFAVESIQSLPSCSDARHRGRRGSDYARA